VPSDSEAPGDFGTPQLPRTGAAVPILIGGAVLLLLAGIGSRRWGSARTTGT
jgi:LPXTG-motif cell wall-anchored protein